MIQCHTKQLSHSNDEILGGNLDKVKHLNKWNGIQSYGLTGLQNKQFTVSKESNSAFLNINSLPLQS